MLPVTGLFDLFGWGEASHFASNFATFVVQDKFSDFSFFVYIFSVVSKKILKS